MSEWIVLENTYDVPCLFRVDCDGMLVVRCRRGYKFTQQGGSPPASLAHTLLSEMVNRPRSLDIFYGAEGRRGFQRDLEATQD